MSTEPAPFVRPFRSQSYTHPGYPLSDSQLDFTRSEPEIEAGSGIPGDQLRQEFFPLDYEEPEDDVLEVPVFPANAVPKPPPPPPPALKENTTAERRIERVLLPFIPISFGS